MFRSRRRTSTLPGGAGSLQCRFGRCVPAGRSGKPVRNGWKQHAGGRSMSYWCDGWTAGAVRLRTCWRSSDGGYFDALVRIFEQTLKAIAQLPASGRHALIARLFRPKFHPMLRNSLIPKKAHDCV